MDFPFKDSILIFTDGACSGNPGPGGWGAVIAWPSGKIKEIGGAEAPTTNNRMEIIASIEALRAVSKDSGEIHFYTDSTYLIRGITLWVWAWRKRQWKTAEDEDVQNKDLWIELSAVVGKRGKENKIHWKYSRGHVGTPGNERCDEIAVCFSQKKWVDLYEGKLLSYSVPIYDVPDDCELPEMRPKEAKKVAYSYLSVIGGTVCRHKDWASCERRVKGQSGAKFKKAMSAEAEPEILKEWGLSPKVEIKDL